MPDPLPPTSEVFPTPPPEVRAGGVEDPPWTFWDVVRIAVVAIVAIGLFGIIAMAIAAHEAASKNALETLSRDPRVVIPAMAAAYVIVIGYMFAVLHTMGRPFWAGVKWNFPGRNALGFAAMGIALAIVVQSVSALLPVPKTLPIDQYFGTQAGAYLMAIFGISFAPLVEELFFRGFLYPVVARKLGVAASVAITALAFALIHEAQLAHAWAPLLLLWCVGLVLTGVRARAHSVGASFCIHVSYNFTLFLLLFLSSDYFRHLEKLTQ